LRSANVRSAGGRQSLGERVGDRQGPDGRSARITAGSLRIIAE